MVEREGGREKKESVHEKNLPFTYFSFSCLRHILQTQIETVEKCKYDVDVTVYRSSSVLFLQKNAVKIGETLSRRCAAAASLDTHLSCTTHVSNVSALTC